MWLIGGLDEVGRGSLAGPMMAAVAVFNHMVDICPVRGVKDSKEFSSEEAREAVFNDLMRCDELLDFGVGSVGPLEIDQLGINKANKEAFRRAMADLKPIYLPNELIVDGQLDVPDYLGQKLITPKADKFYWQVSAASIIAKVVRDRLMNEMHLRWPHFHFLNNKGYGTKTHLEGLRTHGPCEIHRQSFLKKLKQG